MKRPLYVWLLISLFLAACSAKVSVPEAAALPSPEVAATATAAPRSTSTPMALSATPDSTRMTVATLAQATLVMRATQDVQTREAYNRAVTEISQVCESVHSSWSPDNRWLAIDCPAEGNFRLLSHDNYAKIYISHEILFKDDVPPPGRAGYVSTLFWSRERLYLFFTKHVCCEAADSLANSGPVYRFNLETGEWAEVIPGYYNYISYSPARPIFLHIPDDRSGSGKPLTLNIVDIYSLQKKSLVLPDYEQAGFVVWNRSGSAFVMMTRTGKREDDSAKYSLVSVDLISVVTKPLMDNSPFPLVPVDWSFNNVITVRKDQCAGESAEGCMSEFLYYDLKSGKFVPKP